MGQDACYACPDYPVAVKMDWDEIRLMTHVYVTPDGNLYDAEPPYGYIGQVDAPATDGMVETEKWPVLPVAEWPYEDTLPRTEE